MPNETYHAIMERLRQAMSAIEGDAGELTDDERHEIENMLRRMSAAVGRVKQAEARA
jgi:hypothetical protein